MKQDYSIIISIAHSFLLPEVTTKTTVCADIKLSVIIPAESAYQALEKASEVACKAYGLRSIPDTEWFISAIDIMLADERRP